MGLAWIHGASSSAEAGPRCAASMLQTARMRTRLERTYRFEAAHFLPKVPPGHKCARMHGHSYQVDVIIEGEIGEATGWVMDFADIDEHVLPLVRKVDHQVLNEIEDLA